MSILPTPADPVNSKPKVPEQIWTEFTPAIQGLISKEYARIKMLKSSEDFIEDEYVLWATSVLELLKTISPTVSLLKPPDRYSWVRENFTGLMLVTTLLTIVFGFFGVWGLVSASGEAKTATAGFLDIAKLFAGALVGAAGAVGVGAATKK